MNHNRNILVTYALPYANGELHLGHLVGFIQSDIWVRFQKMIGNDCIFISGCDGHGTPIMIQAEKMQMNPEDMIEQLRMSHQQDIADFYVQLDNYHTTHSIENKNLVTEIFNRHLKQNHIHQRVIQQAYDPEKNLFLPDRYIKGECPRCHAKDQYGDNCEICGATYAPTELKNPYSTLSGMTPVQKSSEHYFFKLQDYKKLLYDWTRSGHLQPQVTHKLDEWFEAGLQEWDISRDAPYFGFTIPNDENKYFYCWLDAPIGYMASFARFCEGNSNYSFEKYWQKNQENNNTELYHFIGKDIIYFHALFWPAVLMGASYRTPTAIYAHGFLTINGQKMSKSRGTFITAKKYLAHLPAEYFRYYLATKLNSDIEDYDINLTDFLQRINSDLIGKFINIASRCASFIHNHFGNQLAEKISDPALQQFFVETGDSIAEKFEKREFNQATKQIMGLADRANQYIDEQKPWSSIKDPEKKETTHQVCTLGINLFRLLMIYLKPILPLTAEKAEAFLAITPLQWSHKNTILVNHTIQRFQPLAQRLEQKQVDMLIQHIEK